MKFLNIISLRRSKLNTSEVRLGKFESLLLKTSGRYACSNKGFIPIFDAFLLFLLLFFIIIHKTILI